MLMLSTSTGNGHARDKLKGVFAGLDVFTMDMYNKNIYPHDTRAKRVCTTSFFFLGCAFV
jgi:hypothetical protein